jgi:hypothetical protein
MTKVYANALAFTSASSWEAQQVTRALLFGEMMGK